MRLYERGSYKLVLLTHLPKNEFGESPCASEVCFSQDFVNLGQIEVNCDATHGCFKPPNRCKDTVAQAACAYYKKRRTKPGASTAPSLCTVAKRVSNSYGSHWLPKYPSMPQAAVSNTSVSKSRFPNHSTPLGVMPIRRSAFDIS